MTPWQRAFFMGFALVAYAIFFATFLYLIAFVGNLPWVPRDRRSRTGSAARRSALIVNVALIALFGVQHSVMARQGFKRAWTRIVPEPVERSVYVLARQRRADHPVPVLAADRRRSSGTSIAPCSAGILWALFAPAGGSSCSAPS